LSTFAEAFTNLQALIEEHGHDAEDILEQTYGVDEFELHSMTIAATAMGQVALERIKDGKDPLKTVASEVLHGIAVGLAFARELERAA
jgi:hypothetical protein